VKARILSLDTDEHRTAQELLPWFVNRTLDASEASLVAKHLVHCGRCQGDAAEQAELRAGAGNAETGGDVDRDWAALRGRLGAIPAAPARARVGLVRRWWLPTMVALYGVVLLAMTVVLVSLASHDEPYRALGTEPASVAPNALAVFRSEASSQQMRDALRAADARIVGGPTVSDAYLLRLADASPRALARLRAQPGVLRVEALQGDASR
jgi:hypothetical protein